MPKIIRGTADNKRYNVVRANHPAGPSKLRCPGCKVGMCAEQMDQFGKKVMRCQRCGREHSFQTM